LKCDGTRAETKFRLSAKWTNPFISAGASVQLTTGSRGVGISGSNAGYTMFRGSVKSTGYPLHLPVSPSLPLPCVTMCHHISTGLYFISLNNYTIFFVFNLNHINPLNPELNPICYLLALLGAHHFLQVSRIRVKSLTFRLLMSYIYMEHPFLMFLDHTRRRSTVGRTPLDE